MPLFSEHSNLPKIPVALTIAGSDSGGGAGIQADLKTFEAHGVFGTSALTLITAQNTLGVSRVHVLPPELVAEQLMSVLADFPVSAIKTGALGNAAVVEIVAQVLAEQAPSVPLIIDPVMLAKSGDALIAHSAVACLIERLLPLATLITPNLPEWQALQQAGASPNLPLLLKGGHASGLLLHDIWQHKGQQLASWQAERLDTRHTHGTGCTLSAAIVANLAKGLALEQALAQAHAYLQRALRAAPQLGAGQGPLGHRV